MGSSSGAVHTNLCPDLAADIVGALHGHTRITPTGSVRLFIPRSSGGFCPCHLLQSIVLLPSEPENWWPILTNGGRQLKAQLLCPGAEMPNSGGGTKDSRCLLGSAEAGTSPEVRPQPGSSPSPWALPTPLPTSWGHFFDESPARGAPSQGLLWGRTPKSCIGGLDVI